MKGNVAANTTRWKRRKKPDHDGKGALGKEQGSTNQHHEMNHLPGVLKTEDLENQSQKKNSCSVPGKELKAANHCWSSDMLPRGVELVTDRSFIPERIH